MGAECETWLVTFSAGRDDNHLMRAAAEDDFEHCRVDRHAEFLKIGKSDAMDTVPHNECILENDPPPHR